MEHKDEPRCGLCAASGLILVPVLNLTDYELGVRMVTLDLSVPLSCDIRVVKKTAVSPKERLKQAMRRCGLPVYTDDSVAQFTEACVEDLRQQGFDNAGWVSFDWGEFPKFAYLFGGMPPVDIQKAVLQLYEDLADLKPKVRVNCLYKDPFLSVDVTGAPRVNGGGWNLYPACAHLLKVEAPEGRVQIEVRVKFVQ
jgi:hypothetical protein